MQIRTNIPVEISDYRRLELNGGLFKILVTVRSRTNWGSSKYFDNRWVADQMGFYT